ncbi:unnamed protein product [Knipowitschia caucasica]|uniref:Uncharacterized protein n=1 Tax=Knipowitschia caucasica TaxID=637954 RepID=A0AAV2MPR1_KNICA
MTATAKDLDPFVHEQLIKIGLEEYCDTFAANKIDKESFFLLEETDFSALIPVVGHKAKLRNHWNKLQREREDGDRAQPSTSRTPGPQTPAAGKRKQNPTTKQNKRQKGHKLDYNSLTETKLEAAIDLMAKVKDKISTSKEKAGDKNVFLNFLGEEMEDLNTEKKEQIGLFGRSGAGKSSLINTVINEDRLLPTSVGQACTSVIIKVEANTKDQYEAEVEFISQEEFDDLMFSCNELAETQAKDDESKDINEKMTALFGNERNIQGKEFKKSKKTISELIDKTITLNNDSASELSTSLEKYTKNKSDPSQIMFWPVVKCVTIKVPKNKLLQHVTLVDLPGTGDCNKTRNDMWREMVSCCGTVWVVTEVTRAASESEAWNILESASGHMGNGGECHNIHFICTKSDSAKFSPEEVKNEIIQKFKDLPHIQNQFEENCIQVFIVSTKDTEPEVNEIFKLQDFLQSLNDQRDFVSNYISSAYSILALMKGVRFGNAEQKSMLYEKLCTRRVSKIKQMRMEMDRVYSDFEELLTEGVNRAKEQGEKTMTDKIEIEIGGHFQRFKSVMKKNGNQTSKKGEQINLKTTLSSFLTNSIDLKFRKTFPNSGKHGPFYSRIRDFSLDCEQLIKDNQEVELLLIFLKKEEEKLKTKLCKVIRKRKKQIYNCLTETVEEMMEDGYKDAARKSKVKVMKETVLGHFRKTKDAMFEEAKKNMLTRLRQLMEEILKRIEDDLEKAMTLSLKKEVTSVPDVKEEFTKMEKYYKEMEAK